MDDPNFVAPTTVEEIFEDFRGRYNGLRQALKRDCFFLQAICDPEKENMCLYGLPDGTWKVSNPPDHVPTDLPQPVLGINFRNTDPNRIEDWLGFLAAHSDSWLLSLAFYFAARLTPDEKTRLFDLINVFPTLMQEVYPQI